MASVILRVLLDRTDRSQVAFERFAMVQLLRRVASERVDLTSLMSRFNTLDVDRVICFIGLICDERTGIGF